MAVTIRHTRPVTDDEILELSRRNPGYQFERTATGELVVTPTGSEGGRRSGEVFVQLGVWSRATGGGIVFDASTGFRLPSGALRAPDASWMRRERWQALSEAEREGFAPLCPDAVFEIRSKADAIADLRAKLHEYLVNGARVGVLIDPYERTVELYRPGHDVEMRHGPETVALDPELPGFTLDTEPVFKE